MFWKKKKITVDMFFRSRTPLQSEKEAKEVAKYCPVLVEIERRCDEHGTYVRTVTVSTGIWYYEKKSDPPLWDAKCIKGIAPNLMSHPMFGKHWTLTEGFSTLKAAEEWVQEKLEEIKKNRRLLMRKQKAEKESEAIIIV